MKKTRNQKSRDTVPLSRHSAPTPCGKIWLSSSISIKFCTSIVNLHINLEEYTMVSFFQCLHPCSNLAYKNASQIQTQQEGSGLKYWSWTKNFRAPACRKVSSGIKSRPNILWHRYRISKIQGGQMKSGQIIFFR